ncbi:MAG: ZIP family metal transporter [Candidatus Neomarinimicrobiota bacterium]
MEWFKELNPVRQAFLATCFTWSVTAAGAAVVLLFRNVSQRLLNAMLGFAAGVMIAASYWSLLAPAIEMARQSATPAWIPAVVGFLLGGIFLKIIDKLMPHLHLGLPIEQAEGVKTSWKRTVLLVMAVTIHNIPEGLAVGVAFGAAGAGLPSATLAGAIALALGIGIQNFPEGTAVAVPLRREGLSIGKSFFYGQLSGVVEIIAGVIGAYLVLVMRAILPYALAFAAGAMIYVVVEELIPESQRETSADTATLGAMLGFAVMMMLDVALG